MNDHLEQDTREELATSLGESSGVELDNPEEEVHPFDPLKVSLYTKSLTASDCIKRMEQGTINLSPDFQRNEVWDDVRKSRLIESLMLKIPLPMFYVASDEKENYQVVDGLQRLSTLRAFASDKSMKLKKLEFWDEHNERGFDELPPHLQNRITEANFSFTIIDPGTPDRVKRDVFKRINTGGLPLTDQEIRHALYTGPVTELLKELVNSYVFKRVTDYRIKDSRMAGRELVLRFLSFLIRKPGDYRGTMDEWLSHTMQIINLMPTLPRDKLRDILNENNRADFNLPEIQFTKIDTIKEFFFRAMDRAYVIFKEYAFRKTLPSTDRRSPINKGLFEVWSVILGEMNEGEFEGLKNNKDRLFNKLHELYGDKEFYRSISVGSHKPHYVRLRYEKLRECVTELIKGEYP